MDPLFPRLHVNDTGKVGPRAPPRNKMALFEQLSIPSQRFNAAGASPRPRPLPPHNTATLVPSASSSQGCEHERNMFSPFYSPPQTHAYSVDKVHYRSSDGKNVTASRAEIDGKSDKHATQRIFNASGHFRSAAEISSLSPHNLTRMKGSGAKISEDEDDFRVPTLFDSRIAPSSDKDPRVPDRKKATHFHTSSSKLSPVALSSSLQLPISHENPSESPNTTDLMSGQCERSNNEQKGFGTVTHKTHTEKSVMVKGDKTAKLSDMSKESSKQECTIGALNGIGSSHRNTRAVQESTCNATLGGPRCFTDIEFMDKSDISGTRSISYSKVSLGSSLRSPNLAENYNEESENKVPGSLQLGDADRNDEFFETSMVDSTSGLDISPDDVVGVIGPKHFWKARKAIVHQQRVFAVQVFELHRLIKVQKLIAASPHLLLEGAYLSRSPSKVRSKTLASKWIHQSPQTQVVKHTNAFLREKDECTTENTVRRSPLPSHKDTLNKGSDAQVLRNGHYIGSSTPVPVASDHKSSAWCFQPQGNQWLIPVMSPSEGLIYKPYTGSCPPAAGFMAPIDEGFGPLSLPPVMGNFMNRAYHVPASNHHQNIVVLSEAPAVAPNYFPPPYGLPVVNPIVSNSAVKKARPLAGAHCNGQAEQPSRSSCNISKPKSDALKGRAWIFQTSKGSELQGSTASSPCERVQKRGDVLPLFPMGLANAKEGSNLPLPTHSGDHQTKVIKVVPHNPRSASESAARIFQSIQKEREQYYLA